MLHVSIKAEKLFDFLGFPITNSFLASLIVLFLFLIFSLFFASKSKSDPDSRFVFFVRFAVSKLHDLFYSIFGEKTKVFFPILASFFLLILLSNWFGLIPGVGSILVHTEKLHLTAEKVIEEPVEHPVSEKKELHPPVPLLRASTADLNTTLALALISFVLIQVYGVKYLGLRGYLGKFINVSSPINFFSGILEIVSEFSKIISFTFRLFGNIFAGEVILTVVAFLIPVLASFPFFMLEVLVGFIQAIVFSMLTAVFISTAIAKHH